MTTTQKKDGAASGVPKWPVTVALAAVDSEVVDAAKVVLVVADHAAASTVHLPVVVDVALAIWTIAPAS